MIHFIEPMYLNAQFGLQSVGESRVIQHGSASHGGSDTRVRVPLPARRVPGAPSDARNRGDSAGAQLLGGGAWHPT